MKLIDTHAHLDDARFKDDFVAVLDRARSAGVESILTIGVDLATSLAAIQIAQTHPMVKAVPGIQPNHAGETQPGDWDQIVALAEKRSHVVAIGETGLDRYWDRCPFAIQQEYFSRHLELSRRLQLPVVIHCREAEADIVAMLTEDFNQHGPLSGVMHSFTGDYSVAEACCQVGLHISFAGMVTYKNANTIRDTAKRIPTNRLVIETDSPYLAPVPVRGQRNEPAFVAHTLTLLAKERDVTAEALADATTANAIKLFGLS